MNKMILMGATLLGILAGCTSFDSTITSDYNKSTSNDERKNQPYTETRTSNTNVDPAEYANLVFAAHANMSLESFDMFGISRKEIEPFEQKFLDLYKEAINIRDKQNKADATGKVYSAIIDLRKYLEKGKTEIYATANLSSDKDALNITVSGTSEKPGDVATTEQIIKLRVAQGKTPENDPFLKSIKTKLDDKRNQIRTTYETLKELVEGSLSDKKPAGQNLKEKE